MKSSTRIAILTALLLLFNLRGEDLQAQEAPTSETTAQEHATSGLKAFQEKNYREAIREYKIAYKIHPQSWLLYSWAQAERLAGRCRRAVNLYRRYLRSDLNEKQKNAANSGIKSCKVRMEPEEAAPDATVLPDEDTQPNEEGQPEPGQPEPGQPEPQVERETQKVGLGTADTNTSFVYHPLAIAGLVAVGIGGTLLIVAEQEVSRAQDLGQRDDVVEGLNRGTFLRRTGWTVLTIGAAAVATRYLLHRRSKNESQLSISADQTQASLVWLGLF